MSEAEKDAEISSLKNQGFEKVSPRNNSGDYPEAGLNPCATVDSAGYSLTLRGYPRKNGSCHRTRYVFNGINDGTPGGGRSFWTPSLKRTSKLASRRLKREIERRGTLGEFVLEPDPPHLKGIPTEESGSDLLRSDGPDAAALSLRVESPQSIVQGCSAQGGAVGSGEKES
jgi:hypothetical protein